MILYEKVYLHVEKQKVNQSDILGYMFLVKFSNFHFS